MACVLVLDRAGRRGTYGATKIWGEAFCQDATEDHHRVLLANDGVRNPHLCSGQCVSHSPSLVPGGQCVSHSPSLVPGGQCVSHSPSLVPGDDASSKRALFPSKTLLVLPSNCPTDPDHFTVAYELSGSRVDSRTISSGTVWFGPSGTSSSSNPSRR